MRRPWVVRAALLLGAVWAGACQGEPSRLCDGARLFWPNLEISPEVDVDPTTDGIQLDLLFDTTLPPGTTSTIEVTPTGGKPQVHPQESVVTEDGVLSFSAVTFPIGRVSVKVSIENECGTGSTSREMYVWDGLGIPNCELAFATEPEVVPEAVPLRVWRAEHDDDPGTPSLDTTIEVIAGRPDMNVTLFVLNLVDGTEQALSSDTAQGGRASYDLSLVDGEYAVRAICRWPTEDLSPSSITVGILVDTVAPDCSLVEPTAAVQEADDLDPETSGVQFTLLGASTAADAVGLATSFTVNGQTIDAGALDEDGEATATATLDDPSSPQTLSFSVGDRAGNPCSDTHTF